MISPNPRDQLPAGWDALAERACFRKDKRVTGDQAAGWNDELPDLPAFDAELAQEIGAEPLAITEGFLEIRDIHRAPSSRLTPQLSGVGARQPLTRSNRSGPNVGSSTLLGP
jgi:hypothetical protein